MDRLDHEIAAIKKLLGPLPATNQDGTMMAVEWRHRTCLALLRGARRTVQTQPSEACWPQDVSLVVPSCEVCKCLVTIDDILILKVA